MAIFNNSITDVDYRIVSFLDNEQKVVFSGVNNTAYQLLKNEGYFKALFEGNFPELAQSTTFKNKSSVIHYLCDRHPTNCWKVASCFFQTARLNFSPFFLNAAIPSEIKKLTEEQAALESQLTAATPILDQATLDHEQTQYLLESDEEEPEVRRILKFIDREAEFDNYYNNVLNQISFDRTPGKTPLKILDGLFKMILDFDGRLLPAVNLTKYKTISKEEKSIKENLNTVKSSLSELHAPEFVFKNEKNKIQTLFHNNLVDFIVEISNKPETLNSKDIEIVKLAFRLYTLTSNHEAIFTSKYSVSVMDKFDFSRLNVHTRLNAHTRLAKNPENKTNSAFDSNVKNINDAIHQERDANLLSECVISIAKADFSMEAFTTQVALLLEYRPTLSEDTIKADFRREIQARYGDEAIKKLDQNTPDKSY